MKVQPGMKFALIKAHMWIDDRSVYLSIIKDLIDHAPMGASLEYHMRSMMVINALDRAVRRHRPKPKLIFHSDRVHTTPVRIFEQNLTNIR